MFVSRILEALRKPVLKNTVIYVAAGGINAIIPFLLLPILTAYLTPTEYGVVSTFMVINSLFLILIGLEQGSFISVNFFTKPREEIQSYVSNQIFISFLIFLFLMALGFLMSGYMVIITQMRSQWILFSVVVSFFQFLGQLSLTLWQLNSQSIRYGIYQVLNSLTNYLASILLISQFKMGEAGRIWGITITAIVFGIYSFYYLNKEKMVLRRISLENIKASLLFSLPLVPHTFAGWINTAADRLIINHYVGFGETGLYSINYQVAMIVGLVASSFNRAFMPFVYKTLSLDLEEKKKLIVQYTYLYYVCLGSFALFLGLGSHHILKFLVDERYQQSGIIMYWIILGFTADGFYYGVINYLYFSKKTLYISAITFSSCVVHFVLSIVLIPRIGVLGAAYSTSISYLFTFVIAWIVSSRVLPMPWFYMFRNIANGKLWQRH